jgi:thioesterase domain-containing protein/acyl carrier protein
MSRGSGDDLPPRAHVEKKLAEIWCHALGLDQVGLRDDFFRLGGDSLAAAQVVVEIKRALGRDLPITALHDAPTVEALAAAVVRPTAPAAWSPLVALQPRGSGPPFFCVHGAGGCVLGLADLARLFAPHQPFYGIRAAGRAGYEQPIHHVEDMASHYLEVVRSVQPAGPYYLGGYSFGGSVAFEMAQQLREGGERVALLAILDHVPPPTRFRRATWALTTPVDFAVNAARWAAEDIWGAGRGRRLAALKQKARVLRKQLRNALSRSAPRSGKTDVEEIFVGQPLPDCFRRLLEAHYQALRAYVPRAYGGRVTLFRARTRPLFRLHGRDLGWGRLAGGGLEVITVPGNHETFLKQPHVQTLAKALLAHLDKAREGACWCAEDLAAALAELPKNHSRRQGSDPLMNAHAGS